VAISLNSTSRLVFVKKIEFVFCDVGTDILNAVQVNSGFKWLITELHFLANCIQNISVLLVSVVVLNDFRK
jgi:hypothetical protein